MKKIGKSQVSQLWEQYQQVKFRWSESAFEEDTFAIVTAWNPRSRVQDQVINRIKQQKLVTYLMTNRITFSQILCGNADFSYSEPSLAIRAEEKKALNLAMLYQQNAFYWVTNGKILLKPAILRHLPCVPMGNFEDYLVPSHHSK